MAGFCVSDVSDVSDFLIVTNFRVLATLSNPPKKLHHKMRKKTTEVNNNRETTDITDTTDAIICRF